MPSPHAKRARRHRPRRRRSTSLRSCTCCTARAGERAGEASKRRQLARTSQPPPPPPEGLSSSLRYYAAAAAATMTRLAKTRIDRPELTHLTLDMQDARPAALNVGTRNIGEVDFRDVGSPEPWPGGVTGPRVGARRARLCVLCVALLPRPSCSAAAAAEIAAPTFEAEISASPPPTGAVSGVERDGPRPVSSPVKKAGGKPGVLWAQIEIVWGGGDRDSGRDFVLLAPWRVSRETRRTTSSGTLPPGRPPRHWEI